MSAQMGNNSTLNPDQANQCRLQRFDCANFGEDGDSPEQLLAAFDEDGVIVLENALSNDESDRIVEEMEPFIAATPHGLHGLEKSRRVGALVARSESSHKAIAHPAVLAVCDAALGAQYRHGNEVSIIQRERGQGKYPWRLGLTQIIDVGPGQVRQGLHRGNGLWVHNFAGHQLDLQIETMWALTDFTEENGATHVVPGSHQWSDVTDRNAERTMTWYEKSSFQTARATMKKGSVLVWTGWTLHGAGANTTDSRRIGMNIDYSLSFLSQEENQFLACPPDIARTLSDDMRRLIGYSQPAGALNYFADCLPPRYALRETYDVTVPGSHGMKTYKDL